MGSTEKTPLDMSNFDKVNECIERLVRERNVARRSVYSGEKIYPGKFLAYISIIGRNRLDSTESELYKEAMAWKQRVMAENGGVYDCVVLYDLLLEEEKQKKRD